MATKTTTEALLLQHDAAPRTVEAKACLYEETGLEPDLSELYRLLGCSRVDVIRLPLGDLWIDEEFLLNGSPPNWAATLVCRGAGVETYIAGDALFVPRTERALTQAQEFALSGWSHGFSR